MTGRTVSVGVRGFVGFEYFFAPKISLGAEYGWALGMSNQGPGQTRTEEWSVDADGNGSKSTETDETGSSRSVRVGHDTGIDQLYSSSTAALNLSFYF